MTTAARWDRTRWWNPLRNQKQVGVGRQPDKLKYQQKIFACLLCSTLVMRWFVGINTVVSCSTKCLSTRQSIDRYMLTWVVCGITICAGWQHASEMHLKIIRAEETWNINIDANQIGYQRPTKSRCSEQNNTFSFLLLHQYDAWSWVSRKNIERSKAAEGCFRTPRVAADAYWFRLNCTSTCSQRTRNRKRRLTVELI